MKLIQQSIFKFFIGVCLVLIGLGLANAGGGIGGSGRTAYGSITAFGSIFVNGIEYSTSTANIINNGASNRPESELKLGMAVRVEGSINSDGRTGTATVVEFIGDIEGSIDAAPVITGTRGTFAIYGLVIKTDSKTKYDNVSGLAALVAGDAVEVSGLFNANDGSFSATRIEKQDVFRKVELRGKISNVTATTFKLGPSLIVNYSAAQLRDIPAGGLTNGLFVEVKTTTEPVNNTLAAERVSVESSVLASANIPFGLVQGIAANVSNGGALQAAGALMAKAAGDSSFVMGNQTIVTNAQTVFTGAPLSALVNGVKALATGPVVNGVMTAETVSIVLSGGAIVGADVSGDGKSDLLLRDTGTGLIAGYLMNGVGVTSSSALIGSGGWSASHAADLNGDGKADILWRNSNGTVAAWLMNGLTPSADAVLMAAGAGWTATHTADLDGDGKADILWQHTDGRVAAWLMNGLTPTNGTVFMAAGTGWRITHMTDLNGDGKADILWQHTDGRVATWLMNGLTPTVGVILLGAGTGFSVTHTADLNGDGKADLLWANSSGVVTTWLMDGTNQIGNASLMAAGAGWSVTQTADLNGDGKADILWRHTDGRVAAWTMSGTTATNGTVLMNAGTGWSIAQMADFNGDGNADILWRHTDGRIAIWQMNGFSITGAGILFGPGTNQVLPTQ
jgi:Domain of unknown function (DUF5666)/FG-GAP-like repeat